MSDRHHVAEEHRSAGRSRSPHNSHSQCSTSGPTERCAASCDSDFDVDREAPPSSVHDDSDVECPIVVDEVLHDERTSFQHVLVFRNEEFGVCFSLDGVVQSTQKDEHIYSEFLAHVPLLMHERPSRVLICGGGPGGVVREVLKHPSVDEVVVQELDQEVVAVSRRWLPWQSAALQNPRLTLLFGDAESAIEHLGKFDVILVDGTDVGRAGGYSDRLCSQTFFNACRSCLMPGGFLSTQLGACVPSALGVAWSESAETNTGRLRLADFTVAAYAAEVPSYGGLALFALASVSECDAAGDVADKIALRCLGSSFAVYSAEAHKRAFFLPSPVKSALHEQSNSGAF